jgi:pyruvate kinase
VTAFQTPVFKHTDRMIRGADSVLKANGLGQSGDTVVIVSGAPVGASGTTNQILVHRVGELDVAGSSGSA